MLVLVRVLLGAVLATLTWPPVPALFPPQPDVAVERETTYTDAVLARLGSGRLRLRADIARLVDADPSVSHIIRTNDSVFYLERPAGAHDARLMLARGTTPPRMLLDPDTLAKQLGSVTSLAISRLLPSPDGSHIAVDLVPDGAAEKAHTRILNMVDGTLLPDDLARTRAGPTAWSLDGTTLFYGQLPLGVPGRKGDPERGSVVYAHRLGTSGSDFAVFGVGVDPNVPLQPADDAALTIPAGSNYAIGVVAHAGQIALTLYCAPVAAVLSGGQIPWRAIADVADAVTGFDVHGNSAYLLTHKGAPRSMITTVDLADPEAGPSTVVGEGDGVIEQVAVAGDALYVRGVHHGAAELRKLPWDAGGAPGAIAAIALPDTLAQLATDAGTDGAIVGLVSWTKPVRIEALDAHGTLADSGIGTPSNIDWSAYISRDVQAPRPGGAPVSITIVMKRETRLDGSHPLYLQAGGAAAMSAAPHFLGPAFAWLDAGGIWAIAHVRGGEDSDVGHRPGDDPAKDRPIDDVVAAARYLIAQAYTVPGHLAIGGTRAGAIITASAITDAPELFAAALAEAGSSDTLHSETAPSGMRDGRSATATGSAELAAFDAYAHIVDGRPYPALLGVLAINDPPGAPEPLARFVARLRRASRSGRPVLMRVDDGADQTVLGAPRDQPVALLTDEFSFLMWQCGSAEYAAIPIRPAEAGAHR